jgi:hypothetical protein
MWWKRFMVFYPTLGVSLMRNYFRHQKWPWYSRIDDTVVLGALPFKSMTDEVNIS